MLCASISEHSIRYGQLIKRENVFSVEIIGKKPLSVPFNDMLVDNPNASQSIESVLSQIKADLPIPDMHLSLSIPSAFFNISVNDLDPDMSDEDVDHALNWSSRTRLGNIADKKFTQHYPLATTELNIKRYLTISYFKEIGKILFSGAQPAGFNIDLLDINIFSATSAIEQIVQPKAKEKWGVWLVDENRHSLLIIDSGEFQNYAEFQFSGETEYTILSSAKADTHLDSVISELCSLKSFAIESLGTLDHLYFYSNDVDSDFFNMLETYEVTNMSVIDPFKNLKPIVQYRNDGDGIGAMCQFSDVVGLIQRRMVWRKP
ncbi:MAG: hypothetical protein PHW79_09195 [Candidatus Marinimicrobia bacterium]|nr:hypothetical protein [Candidatus Neomarinimicrobiota bacterium]